MGVRLQQLLTECWPAVIPCSAACHSQELLEFELAEEDLSLCEEEASKVGICRGIGDCGSGDSDGPRISV